MIIREWVRERASRRMVIAAAAGGTLVVGGVAFLLLGGGATGPRLGTPPSATAESSATPVPSGAPSGSAPVPRDWTALSLAPYEPIAELVPDESDGSGISVDGSFTFRSLTSTPAVDLAAGLVVEPPVDLRIEPGRLIDLATVRPTGPLVENAHYRVSLHGTDGALVGEWSFRTGGPLHVVRQLPDDRSTQVPVDTGIEIEFDQDDVVDVAAHFSIEPAVEGEFEVHGRTWAFVPAAPLEPATLYAVTVTSGVSIRDSAQTLESPVRFAFETAGPEDRMAEARIAFDRPMHEARPDEAPVIPVGVYADTDEAAATTRHVVVYGLGTLAAAMDAATTLSVDRGWAIWSANGGVPTDGLTETAAFDAAVTLAWPNQVMELPTGFAAGWYLVEIPQDGRHAQLVLQVTDLAAYVLVSETRTVAWVNDLGPGTPVGGAAVVLPDGSSFGQTDAAGLFDGPTPGALLSEPDVMSGPPLLLVSAPDGRRIIAMTGEQSSWYWGPRAASSRWWLLFGTDRLQYRSDDTIRAWGLVRSRIDRSVPGGLEVRLAVGWDIDGPPIARTPVTASTRGVVVGELPVRDLPPGQYVVGLFVGEESVAQASVTVTDIRKPVFRVEVTSDRLAYITGDPVQVRAAATFYDGSGAPGLRLRVTASAVRGAGEDVAMIDATGAAKLTFVATTSGPSMDVGNLGASPAEPEEGSSYANASFAVFPSTAWLEADATIDDDLVTISGRLTRVDLAVAASQMASGWVDDPSGEALPGRQVSVVVNRVTWRPIQVGTTYDFLEKKTVPLIRYEREVDRIGTFTPTSGDDGAFLVTLPFSGSAGVEVTLRAADEEGREIELMAWADRPAAEAAASTFPYLEFPNRSCGWIATRSATIGEAVSLTVRNGDGSPSVGSRTLFVVGRLGIEEVVITTGAELERAFEERDLPSLTVRAIQFSPAGYVLTNDVIVGVGDREKAIDVAIEPSQASYGPGDDVGVTIATTGPDGAPIAADVVVQAIDLKLFAIGAAQEITTAPLMAPVSAGFSGAYVTHRVPPPASEDGCGATTGGGEPRDDFQDTATFQRISTGADGRGTATFAAPDDLTSWVVSATAMGDGLESGTSSIEIPVGLPFFVDATIAPEYLVGEEPILQLRAYGDALAAGEAVRFTIEAPSLGLGATTVEGRAFEAIRAPLPSLPLGEHVVTIAAERAGSGTELRDSIRRTVRVVPTRLRTLRTAYDTVTDTLRPRGGDGLTTYVVSDAGRGALIPLLQDLAWSSSARFDASLAAELARQSLVEDFGLSEESLPTTGFAGNAGQPPEGLALLPYASADLALTARAALVAPDRLPTEYMAYALRTAADEASSRERRIVALTGLAAVGQDVLGELREAAVGDLTVRERAWFALGLLAGGDEDAARSIERAILGEHGQRLDRWVRLDVGTETPEAAEVTASMLLLAAGLRDPIAADLSRYLLDNPPSDYLPALEQVGFARSAVEWLPRTEARFAWTVDGERHEETLERGTTFALTLTGAQGQSFVVERLDGDLLVASAWSGEARYDELPNDPAVSIERTVSPANHAPTGALVRVTLDVAFSGVDLGGCYQVTDLLPSGLSPVVAPAYGPSTDPAILAPYEVEGQRVSWCIDDDRSTARLGYSARVVSGGTYRWEPAVIQLPAAPSVGSSTPVTTYEID